MNDRDNPIYATSSKIALLFGLNQGTLANLRSKKQGPPYKKLGRKVLYSVDEVTQWLQTQKAVKK